MSKLVKSQHSALSFLVLTRVAEQGRLTIRLQPPCPGPSRQKSRVKIFHTLQGTAPIIKRCYHDQNTLESPRNPHGPKIPRVDVAGVDRDRQGTRVGRLLHLRLLSILYEVGRTRGRHYRTRGGNPRRRRSSREGTAEL